MVCTVTPEPMCSVCNWKPHPASIHGKLCGNGHALEVVGTYTLGQPYPVCRACQHEAAKRYRDRNLERERERWRAWYQRSHEAPGAGRRLAGGTRKGRSAAREGGPSLA